MDHHHPQHQHPPTPHHTVYARSSSMPNRLKSAKTNQQPPYSSNTQAPHYSLSISGRLTRHAQHHQPAQNSHIHKQHPQPLTLIIRHNRPRPRMLQKIHTTHGNLHLNNNHPSTPQSATNLSVSSMQNGHTITLLHKQLPLRRSHTITEDSGSVTQRTQNQHPHHPRLE